eukprot:scaffold12966_cov78-Skeletonema_dohrnii-CCMP3373.AAC.2
MFFLPNLGQDNVEIGTIFPQVGILCSRKIERSRDRVTCEGIRNFDDGRNALLAAAEYNAHEALNLLIRSGADTTVRDKSGRDYHDLLALPWPRDDDE